MDQIRKGTIASISGNTARVVPSDASGEPTALITIPWHLRQEYGNLEKGTVVVYAVFDDATGLLLGRADGEGGTGSTADYPSYNGAYTVTPLADADVTLETAEKLLTADITVQKIPYVEVTNASGGTTIYIASEVQ